jgi:hypothetical protein
LTLEKFIDSNNRQKLTVDFAAVQSFVSKVKVIFALNNSTELVKN